MMSLAGSTLVLLLGLVGGTLGARVLGVFAHPVRSNALFCHSVMAALATKGHHVVVYSPFKPQNTVPNMTHVEVRTEYHNFIDRTFDFQYLMDEVVSKPDFGGRTLRTVALKKCESFFQHEKIQNLLKSNENFDLVVTEGTFGEESLLVFGYIFKAPTVAILPTGVWSVVNLMAGNALSIAHIPDYVAFPFSDRMSFSERVWNFFSTVTRITYYYLHELPSHDEILKRHAGDLGAPRVEVMVRNISLTLVNTHPTVGYSQPYSPNIVPIGGIQLTDNSQPLPQDIQQFMDNAAEGVIYLSLGSIVPVDSMPTILIDTFINVFEQFPQKVIWKISPSVFTKLPKNTLVSKWLPQKMVIAHPKCKLFITHGGIGSQYETFQAGVPVIGIPFMLDQPYNIRVFEELGMGLGLSIKNLTEQSLYSAVNAVLTNPRYMTNAKRVSSIFKDLPRSAADTAVYWMEYAIRHRGAPHLRPHAANLPWYQLILLDVIAVTLAVILFVIVIIIFLFRKALIYFCGTTKKLSNQKYKRK